MNLKKENGDYDGLLIVEINFLNKTCLKPINKFIDIFYKLLFIIIQYITMVINIG